MRKDKRVDLGLTITAAVFFVIAAALFFLLPTIDNAIAANPSGVGYDPLNLFVNGFFNLLTFNFASKYYMIVFVTGCVIAFCLVLWLIMIIVKKQPKKLVLFFLIALMAFGTACLVSGYVLTTCRIVKLDNGVELHQRVINDLLGKYTNLKDANGATPFVLYNTISMILAIVELGAMAFVALFAILAPTVGGATAPNRRKAPLEEPVEEKEEEPVETPEEIERRKEEERLISYVEYKAGKQARQKEYEALCKAHGIALEEPVEEEPVEEEVDDDEYYRITAAQLRCLHEQPAPKVEEQPVVDEKEDDEAYYEELKKLPVFRMSKVSQNLKIERYYNELINELAAVEGSLEESQQEPLLRLRERAKEQKEYYERLRKELPCLQYQKDPVEPKIK